MGEHLVQDRLLNVGPDGRGRLTGGPAVAARGGSPARSGRVARTGWVNPARGANRANRASRTSQINRASCPSGHCPSQDAVRAPGLRVIAPPGAAGAPPTSLTGTPPTSLADAPPISPAAPTTPTEGAGQGTVHAGAPVGGGGHTGHVRHGHDHAHLRRRGLVVGNDGDGPGTAEEAGDLGAGGDGRGQPDALGGAVQEVIEALQGQGQVGAALGAGEGVDLVDDDGLHGAQCGAHGAGEHEVEGLRRRNEDVRRAGGQAAALGGGGVPGAYAHAHRDGRAPELRGGRGNAGQGAAQVALDVDPQRLERGDVQDAHAAPGRPRAPRTRLADARGPGRAACGAVTVPRCVALRGGVPDEPVDGGEEGGQRLARPGGGDDERVLAAADRRPGALLDRRRAAGEGGGEPGPGRGGEVVQWHSPKYGRAASAAAAPNTGRPPGSWCPPAPGTRPRSSGPGGPRVRGIPAPWAAPQAQSQSRDPAPHLRWAHDTARTVSTTCTTPTGSGDH